MTPPVQVACQATKQDGDSGEEYRTPQRTSARGETDILGDRRTEDRALLKSGCLLIRSLSPLLHRKEDTVTLSSLHLINSACVDAQPPHTHSPGDRAAHASRQRHPRHPHPSTSASPRPLHRGCCPMTHLVARCTGFLCAQHLSRGFSVCRPCFFETCARQGARPGAQDPALSPASAAQVSKRVDPASPWAAALGGWWLDPAAKCQGSHRWATVLRPDRGLRRRERPRPPRGKRPSVGGEVGLSQQGTTMTDPLAFGSLTPVGLGFSPT